MGKFCQFLTVICPQHNEGGILSFYVLFLFISLENICCGYSLEAPQQGANEYLAIRTP